VSRLRADLPVQSIETARCRRLAIARPTAAICRARALCRGPAGCRHDIAWPPVSGYRL